MLFNRLALCAIAAGTLGACSNGSAMLPASSGSAAAPQGAASDAATLSPRANMSVARFVSSNNEAIITPDNVTTAWGSWSIAGNPNGPWSYLYNGNTALTTPEANPCFGVTGLECWWNGQNVPTSASIAYNATNATLSFLTIKLPRRYLSLDPESNANVAVRFSPATGPLSYNVNGDFRGIDVDEAAHNVEIDATISGQPYQLFSGQISSYGQDLPFKLKKLCLGIDDFVSFVVDGTPSTDYLSTGLKAKLVSDKKRCKRKKA